MVAVLSKERSFAYVIGKMIELVMNVVNLDEVLDCEAHALPFW